ncbi:MAG: spore germination protein [Clostridia bacterium]
MEFDKVERALEAQLNIDNFVKKKELICCGAKVSVFFSDGLVDQFVLDEFVARPLASENRKNLTEKTLKDLLVHIETRVEPNFQKAVLAVFDGDSLLVAEGIDGFFLISAKKYSTRAITEPPTASVIKGPREGFTEDLISNISLIKRKLKTPDLRFEFLIVGRRTRTKVCLVKLFGVADETVYEKLKSKLEQIDIDGICDSSYIKSFIKSRPLSIFRQVGDTEKPDILQAKLLEGRIGVIVDGSPLVLTLPFMFMEDLQSADDYYIIPHRASFVRALRFFSMCLGVFMPGFYVACQVYHLSFIPLRFLMTIANSMKGIPFSPNIEMLFTLFIFEMLNEASIRMPRYVGMALSVVGALVLGDTAVQAGIISTPTILIMALSGIAVYTVPDERNTLSTLRLVFLLICGSLGVVGMLGGLVVISIYLGKMSNYGVAYLAPFAPYSKNDLKDGIFKCPLPIENSRPESLKSKNKTRLIWKN